MKIFTILFILLLPKVESTTYDTPYGVSKEEGQTKFFGSCDKQTLLLAKLCLQLPKDILDDINNQINEPSVVSGRSENDDTGSENDDTSIIEADDIPTNASLQNEEIYDETDIEMDDPLILNKNFINKKVLENILNNKFDFYLWPNGPKLPFQKLSLLKAMADKQVSIKTQIIETQSYIIDNANDFLITKYTPIIRDKNASYKFWYLALEKEADKTLLVLLPDDLWKIKSNFAQDEREYNDTYYNYVNKVNKNENYNNLPKLGFFKCIKEMINYVSEKKTNYKDIESILNLPKFSNIQKFSLSEKQLKELFSLPNDQTITGIKTISINNLKPKIIFPLISQRDYDYSKLMTKKLTLSTDKSADAKLIYKRYYLPEEILVLCFTFDEQDDNYTLWNSSLYGRYNDVTLGISQNNEIVIVELTPGEIKQNRDPNTYFAKADNQRLEWNKSWDKISKEKSLVKLSKTAINKLDPDDLDTILFLLFKAIQDKRVSTDAKIATTLEENCHSVYYKTQDQPYLMLIDNNKIKQLKFGQNIFNSLKKQIISIKNIHNLLKDKPKDLFLHCACNIPIHVSLASILELTYNIAEYASYVFPYKLASDNIENFDYEVIDVNENNDENDHDKHTPAIGEIEN